MRFSAPAVGSDVTVLSATDLPPRARLRLGVTPVSRTGDQECAYADAAYARNRWWRVLRAATVSVFVQRFGSTARGARLARPLVLHRLDAWGVPYGSETSDTAALHVAHVVTHGRVHDRDFEVTAEIRGWALPVAVSDTRGELRPPPRARHAPTSPARAASRCLPSPRRRSPSSYLIRPSGSLWRHAVIYRPRYATHWPPTATPRCSRASPRPN
ncbi:hypothetical protein ACFRCW_21075 [Streptomyces sp. NPDC056653]|uniref:hypothetical protein n=1 Tax=Streptomyces sp. NPDC056653 TaxID=3345894 RepID=UPI0036BA4522